MNVALHVDADELARLELADRRYMSDGRRMVSVGGVDGFTAWVPDGCAAREVAAAWLAIAQAIEADELAVHDSPVTGDAPVPRHPVREGTGATIGGDDD